MSPDEYIEKRLEQYKGWYDKKAVTTKAKYLRMRTASVVAGAVVPVLVNIEVPYIRAAVTTTLSLLVVVFVSMESVFHFREQMEELPFY